MQRKQHVLLPGESRPNIFPQRYQQAASAAAHLTGTTKHTPAMSVYGTARPPMTNITQKRAENMTNVNPKSTTSTIQTAAATQARGAAAMTESIEQDYRAGRSLVNVDDYFIGVLGQFKDDSAIMNPMNVGIQPYSEQISTESNLSSQSITDTEVLLNQLAEKIAPKNVKVGLTIPIAQSAIDDTRIFFDSLILSESYGGYSSGEIPMQFVSFNGISPPDRIVKITLTPFNFPHIYLPSTLTFDIMYFRSVFMTVRFIPVTNLTQSASPNEMFTFELYVDRIDSSAVYLVPLESSFILKQPISVTGDLTVKFQVRSPMGGMYACPIPPTRVRVRRFAAPIGGPTTFSMMDGTYIGVLAPGGALYDVAILFQKFGPPGPLSPLEALFINTTGFLASAFSSVGAGSFNVPVDSSAIGVGPADDFYIFIPKNGVSFVMRFSSLQSTKTNDLIPIHM